MNLSRNTNIRIFLKKSETLNIGHLFHDVTTQDKMKQPVLGKI
jgi:hypothetical protein